MRWFPGNDLYITIAIALLLIIVVLIKACNTANVQLNNGMFDPLKYFKSRKSLLAYDLISGAVIGLVVWLIVLSLTGCSTWTWDHDPTIRHDIHHHHNRSYLPSYWDHHHYYSNHHNRHRQAHPKTHNPTPTPAPRPNIPEPRNPPDVEYK